MNKIIALQGAPSVGKTTTIGKLYESLSQRGYTIILPKARQGSKDFFVVFEKNNKTIGITTYGETASLIKYRLARFIKENCSVIVCACHEEGTLKHRFVKNYPLFIKRYIIKSVTPEPESQEVVNSSDANTILDIIESEM